MVWFLSEAIAKKGKILDVYLSDPLSLEEMYETLSKTYNLSVEELKSNDDLTSELSRRFTYELSDHFPQELNYIDSPEKL